MTAISRQNTFVDNILAGAILDRIVHHFQTFNIMKGPSYRAKTLKNNLTTFNNEMGI